MTTITRWMLAATIAIQPLAAGAITTEEHLAWVNANRDATPQFVDGDTITFDKADLIRPFIPLEYQDDVIFDGMQVKIKDAGDLSPPQVYQDATAKFQPQVVLAADGAIENYVAGRPFDPTKFTPGSKEDGFKAIWNHAYRWQFQGLRSEEIHWVWVRQGGNHDTHEIMSDRYKQYYQGGGTFERALTGPYQRVYLSHRADLAASAYKLPERWAENTEFREYTGFTDPFDIAGTAFLILRYNDARKADDSWAYIPSLRRVRRISVEVKSDSLLGTDDTLEDFYGFSGRVLEHDWEYVGSMKILTVARSRNTDTVYYGPNGWVPLDDWALRDVDVVRQTPKRDNHPYSTKVHYMDRQTGEILYSNAFDRSGQLWKLWWVGFAWSEDPQYHDQDKFGGKSTPAGTRLMAFTSINVIDKLNKRATLVPCRGNSYPDNDPQTIRRLMDVNFLTEGR